MPRTSIYRWYESFEEARKCTLQKGGPVVPCWQMNEIVQNTYITCVVDDDSHTSLFWSSSLSSIFQRNGLHIGKETGNCISTITAYIWLTLWHNSLLRKISKLYPIQPIVQTLHRTIFTCTPFWKGCSKDIIFQTYRLSIWRFIPNWNVCSRIVSRMCWRLAIRLLRKTRKRSWNTNNEKCTVRYFAL